MQKIVSVKIGKERHTFAFEGNTIWECVRKAHRHMFKDIAECGICGSDELSLMAFYPQEEFKYVKVLCRKCNSSLTFGSPKKDPDVYYPRKKEDGEFKWEMYKKDE